MKKYLFLLLLILGMGTIYAANTDSIATSLVEKVDLNVVYKDAKSIVSTLDTRADSLLVKSARIISNAANNLWDILVRQQRIMAYYLLFAWILSCFSLYRSTALFTKYYELHNKDNQSDYFAFLIGIAVWIILGLIGFVYCGIHFREIFTGLFNPEYGALQELYSIGSNTLKQ